MELSPWVRFTATERRERGAAHRVLIEPSLDIHARHFVSSIGRLSRALQMESYPKFHNEVGVPIVRIGCREFKCIGDKPPQDFLRRRLLSLSSACMLAPQRESRRTPPLIALPAKPKPNRPAARQRKRPRRNPRESR